MQRPSSPGVGEAKAIDANALLSYLESAQAFLRYSTEEISDDPVLKAKYLRIDAARHAASIHVQFDSSIDPDDLELMPRQRDDLAELLQALADRHNLTIRLTPKTEVLPTAGPGVQIVELLASISVTDVADVAVGGAAGAFGKDAYTKFVSLVERAIKRMRDPDDEDWRHPDGYI